MNYYAFLLSPRDDTSPVHNIEVVIRGETKDDAQVILDKEFPESEWKQLDSYDVSEDYKE